MSAYLIVEIEVHDAERYKGYVAKAPAFIDTYQGEYLVRGGEAETVEGNWQPKRLVVVKFPSREQARAFLDDPEYQAVATIRHAATTTNMVLVDGFDAG